MNMFAERGGEGGGRSGRRSQVEGESRDRCEPRGGTCERAGRTAAAANETAGRNRFWYCLLTGHSFTFLWHITFIP